MLLPKSSDSADQQEILDALPVLVFLERAGNVVFANAEARQMIGLDEPEWSPRPVDDILWGLSSGTAEPRTLLAGTRRGSPFHATLTTSDGRLLPIEGTYRLLNGEFCDAIIVAHPGGARPAPRSRFMEDVLSSLPEAVVIVHGDRILYTNAAFTQMFGYTADEAEGADLSQLIVPESRAHEHALLEMTLESGAHRPIHTVRTTKESEPVEVSILSSPLEVDGATVGSILTFRVLARGNQLGVPDANDSLHDPLTGLPNRALFRDRLSLALTRRSRRREQTCAVLLLALEPLSEQGDPQVRAASDALLVAVAERLRAGLRLQDSAARLEAGEFAILVENILDPGDLDIVASRLLREMERPFEIPGDVLRPAFSIGAAMATAAHTVPEFLLRDAAHAIYTARQEGGSRYEIFDRNLDIRFTPQQERERELRNVLDARQFEFWYQPIFRLQNGKLEGFESLLRRRHPDGSVDSFRDLLPVAEDSGLSISLCRETLDAVCRQLEKWTHEARPVDLSLTVNLSDRQFFHPDLLAQVKTALAATRIDPWRLVLEIQETTLNADPDASVSILERLVECRVRIAVDNFGSSLAPLNHLMSLPITVLKLDPRLTAASTATARKLTVLKSLVRLGHTLGIQVVAPGIETPEQLTALCRMGCELGQGTLLSRPLNSDQALKLVEQGCWVTPAGS
ncbi:MAG: EAL domain-containing protein [Terracidiphilus sp.]